MSTTSIISLVGACVAGAATLIYMIWDKSKERKRIEEAQRVSMNQYPYTTPNAPPYRWVFDTAQNRWVCEVQQPQQIQLFDQYGRPVDPNMIRSNSMYTAPKPFNPYDDPYQCPRYNDSRYYEDYNAHNDSRRYDDYRPSPGCTGRRGFMPEYNQMNSQWHYESLNAYDPHTGYDDITQFRTPEYYSKPIFKHELYQSIPYNNGTNSIYNDERVPYGWDPYNEYPKTVEYYRQEDARRERERMMREMESRPIPQPQPTAAMNFVYTDPYQPNMSTVFKRTPEGGLRCETTFTNLNNQNNVREEQNVPGISNNSYGEDPYSATFGTPAPVIRATSNMMSAPTPNPLSGRYNEYDPSKDPNIGQYIAYNQMVFDQLRRNNFCMR